MVFKCSACHDYFRSEEGLFKHFVCNCKNVFFTGLTHDELYPYLIDPCKIKYDKNIIYTVQKNYQFDNVEELSIIIKILHLFIESEQNMKRMDEYINKEEKKHCPFCYKTFSTNSNLTKHVKNNNCKKQTNECIKEFNGTNFDNISKLIEMMKLVILDLGGECKLEDVFKDERMEIYRKEDGYDSEYYHLLFFLKRNPFFSFEVKDSSEYIENNILIKPKVYMYYHKNLTSKSNSFDECFEMRHMNSDYLFLLQKDSILLFIKKYLGLSKNINIYVESIKGMIAIIHYRNMIIDGNEVKKDVLFRPTNILYVFKNWIQSIYFLIMDIIRHYVFESTIYEHKNRVEIYKLLRRNLQQQYADIMDNHYNFKNYVKKILKLFQEKHKVCKANYFREITDNRVYTGEILIVNKVFDEILQTEEKKQSEEKDRDLELLKKYDIESSDLIPTMDIIKMGEDIVDKTEDDDSISSEDSILHHEED
jgi:hypothetical protein